jgi:hypothetical protein
MKHLLIILLFASCTPTWHVKKAIKKGWTPEKETITKRTFKLLPIHDTITNDVVRVDTIHELETRTIYQDRPLLRYETRLIRDTVRIIQRAETRQTNAQSKAEVKVSKQENKRSKWWLYMLIGGALVYFRKYLWKIIKFLISQLPF